VTEDGWGRIDEGGDIVEEEGGVIAGWGERVDVCE
jgi:hypothetical protein